MVLATIMQFGGLQYVAVARPGVNDLSPGPINPLLQFGNNIFWFLVVAGIQLIFTVLIYERYVGENPSSSFVDVCTVAKVSLLIMDQKYHGYYLHCNAPHEHSDGSMAELGEHLFEEAAAMRVGRGLPGCPDASCQSFELHVPALWREMYDRVYRRLLEAETQEAIAASAGNTAAGAAQLQIQAMQMQAAQQQQQRAGGGNLALVNSNPNSATSLTALSKVARVRDKTRRLGAAFAALTAFLKGFIEESDPDYRRQWRERTLVQQMFDLPPDMLGESLVLMQGQGGGGMGGGSILPGGMGMGMGGGVSGGIGGMLGGGQQGGAIGGGGSMMMSGPGGGSRSTIMMLDRGYRFERVMWRGIELDLLVWDMLVYCFTDYFQQSPTLSAVVTLVANMALQYLRKELGQRNIARKTLVDERFLE
jgi:Meckelin (Transmembrane protein 67)